MSRRHSTHRRTYRTAPALHIKFISYSANLGRPPLQIPALLTVDCTHLHAPSASLQKRYTGLDAKLSDSFFARTLNEEAYQTALDRIYIAANHWTEESDYEHEREEVAVLVKCMAGMHRSVAMVERLADEVSRWRGVKVRTQHADLREAVGAMEEKGYGPYIRWWRVA